MSFDAIVIGSGITGGWAAKELTEAGLKTVVLERGPWIEHRQDYSDFQSPWQVKSRGLVPELEIAEHYPVQGTCYAFSEANKKFWVRDSDHAYLTPENRPFLWIRGYHLGGRSLMWGRQTYRWSDIDFDANRKDGHGVDWPIRYADIAPWYDHVERFAGVSGALEGLAQLPDGQFQPAMEYMCVEQDFKKWMEAKYPTRKVIMGRCAHLTEPTAEQIALGRTACQFRTMCERGCSFGAYFSSLSATLPAARKTGNLTVITDAIVNDIIYDPHTRRATGVRIIDAKTKAGRSYEAKMVFVCASTIGSAQIMLNSRSEAFPTGIANRSDALGRYLMDHLTGAVGGTYPGFRDRYYSGRRPNDTYIPRYRNVTEPNGDLVRGYAFQGSGWRDTWTRGAEMPAVGAELKTALQQPGDWKLAYTAFAEMLPRADNRVTLHPTKRDRWGIPVLHIDCRHSDNDLALLAKAKIDMQEMLTAVGCTDITIEKEPSPPGLAIHEMGTVRMGRDPATSVLNGFNQAHDVNNLFVTDGACMPSTACQNPSLTYMGLTARAANHAAALFKAGTL